MTIWDDSLEQYAPGGRPAYWEALPIVAAYQNRRSTGDASRDGISEIHRHLAALAHRPRRLLWIGCIEGDPSPDMNMALAGVVEEVHVHDIAEGLLAKQRERAARAGITSIDYIATDLNIATFPANHYDAVIGWGTIHHVEALEHLFTQIKRTLRPGGMFLLREYVGPTRIQFTDRQLEIANRLLARVPENRRRHAEVDAVVGVVASPNIADLIAADPSESVRSGDIIRVARRILPGLVVRGTGGTILHPLLSGIAWNFQDPDGEAIVGAFIELEETLIDSGALPSDYCAAYWVKPRSRWRTLARRVREIYRSLRRTFG